MSSLTPQQLETAVRHLEAAKMFSVASTVMSIYDVILTFSDEVELIWSRKFTFVSVLWYIVRYVPPLEFIIVTVSFNSNWSKSVCTRYVVFPEASKIVYTTAIGGTFILRLYAIYQKNLLVLVFFSSLLLAEVGLKIWAFTGGTYLRLPPGTDGCILVGKSNLRLAFTWIAELIFDSLVFFATLYRAISGHGQIRHLSGNTLLNVIIRDGIIYFAVIFAANLLSVLMFAFAPSDLKAITASFTALILSVMVCRLILNLRSMAERTTEQDQAFELGRK